MTGRPVREQWRREVFCSPLITDSTRILLLALVDHMQTNGYVCVSRTLLAKQLGRSERRISERYEAAVEARLLDRVSRGAKGHTASYRALLQDPQRVTDHSTLCEPKGDGSEHPLSPVCGTHGGPALEAQRVTHGGPASTRGEPDSQPILRPARTALRPSLERKKDVDPTPLPTASSEIVRKARESWGMTA